MVHKTGIDEKQPLISHMTELRDRILICAVALGVVFIFTFYFKERIFNFLMQPFIRVMPEKSSFIFTYITEAFITYVKISIVAAFFITLPVILYEFWMFVSPGLYQKEKKYLLPFIIFGSICFLCGATFCYYVVMPVMYKFFISYAGEFVIPMPDLKAYMSLTLRMLVIFGLIFELPLVAYYLSKIGIINHKLLSSKRRYAILGIFIVSAVITPPDITSQILMAIPLCGLYELSIIITRIFGKKVVHDETA
jgi:sec-independent protein translocase protein TatC